MKVTFLHAAEHDLGNLFSYIKNELQNEVAARNIATKILQRTQMLANFPELGTSLANIDHKLSGYRYLLVDNYLVIYKVRHHRQSRWLDEWGRLKGDDPPLPG